MYHIAIQDAETGRMTVVCCVIENDCCVLSGTDTVIVKLWDSTYVKQLSQNFPSKKMFPGKLTLFSVSDLKKF